KKAKAVVRYATHTHICRTLLLLEYFNEFDAHACGVCDNCLKNKRNEIRNDANVAGQIIQFLDKNNGISPGNMAGAFENIPEPVFLKTVQDLIEEEVIRYDTNGNLSLTNKTQH